MRGLNVFLEYSGLPTEEWDLKCVLETQWVKRVVMCALGPEGTNIAQASQLWVEKMGIADKAEVRLCETPEASLEKARTFTEDGVIAFYGTCAVYTHEARFFFQNPRDLPFFAQVTMNLDVMQLATRSELVAVIQDDILPGTWQIAAHLSPHFLLTEEMMSRWVEAKSNGDAAKMCAQGEVEVCITTESARRIFNLVGLHTFGSPPMVFFFGITEDGAKFLKEVYAKLEKLREHLCTFK